MINVKYSVIESPSILVKLIEVVFRSKTPLRSSKIWETKQSYWTNTAE